MRPIKFRFWTGEKMIHAGLVEAHDGSVWENEVIGYPGDFSDRLSKRDWLPLQFTGLHDKNGQEIYEGDVLSVDDSMYIVEWNVNGHWHYKRTPNTFIRGTDLPRWEGQVIGNLHDNPELLEGQ